MEEIEEEQMALMEEREELERLQQTRKCAPPLYDICSDSNIHPRKIHDTKTDSIVSSRTVDTMLAQCHGELSELQQLVAELGGLEQLEQVAACSMDYNLREKANHALHLLTTVPLPTTDNHAQVVLESLPTRNGSSHDAVAAASALRRALSFANGDAQLALQYEHDKEAANVAINLRMQAETQLRSQREVCKDATTAIQQRRIMRIQRRLASERATERRRVTAMKKRDFARIGFAPECVASCQHHPHTNHS